MKTFFRTLWQHILKRKTLSIVVLVIILIVVFRNGKETDPSIFTVVRGDFVKSVAVSGKVVASQDVDMSFDATGKINRVYKQVGDEVKQGDVIVSLDSSDLQAERQKAAADVLSARAELSKLKAEQTGMSTEVSSNTRLVVNAILDAYTNADDAVRNKVDQFYENGRRTNPEIRYTFDNYFSTKDKLNDGREAIEAVLVSWQKEALALSVDNYNETYLNKAYTNLLTIKRFLDDVSFAVNSFEESDNLTKTTIEKYRGDIATARSNVNTAMSELTTISDGLRSSLSDIPVYEARVKSAEASLLKVDAEIAKTFIRAPFDGVLARQDAKVGEAISANTKIVSVISKNFEVEVFIPEVSISEVAIENKVEIELDAYPDKQLTGIVSHVDPAETEKDGVSNYKVKVRLLEQDKMVLPGMSADVLIEKERREGIISIPLKFLIPESNKVIIYTDKKTQEERELVLGEQNGKGFVEVISGLEEGEVLFLPPVVVK